MLASFTIALLGTLPTAPLADLFVDAAANCLNGTGSAASPFCTIGEALAVAVSGDVIRIAPGTYPEELTVNTDVQLLAQGAPGSVVLDGQSSRNLLTVESGATVTVSGLWLKNASGSGSNAKGNVVNRGGLTLRNSTISNSRMNGCCGRAIIFDEPGSQGLAFEQCTVRNNYINGSSASVIRSYGTAGLTIRNSSVIDNYAYVGPTIRAGLAPVLIEGSFFESSSYQTGAAIQARDADLALRNTTITGTRTTALNVSGNSGYQLIENSTLTNDGTSIRVSGTSVPRVRGSVLGAAASFSASVSVTGTFLSLGYNLVERADPTSSGFVDGVLGDQVGSISQPIDPMLDAAADHGGPTRSRLPLPGSPAIDAGHPTDFLSFDQNGFPRALGGSDIGATELPVGLIVICTSVPNSTGDIARLRITGSGDLSRNAFELFVDRVPPGMTGLFLNANAQGFVANPGGSTGNLCLGGAIGRFVGPGQVQTSGAEGQLRLRVDLTAIPQGAGTVAAMAGQGWVFQSWFRDTALGVATSNFSTAKGLFF